MQQVWERDEDINAVELHGDEDEDERRYDHQDPVSSIALQGKGRLVEDTCLFIQFPVGNQCVIKIIKIIRTGLRTLKYQ